MGVATQSGPAESAYVPPVPPRIAVASDGVLAALHEPSRVVVVELPSCAVRAEIRIDPRAEASDVAWVGPPSRLLIVARYAGHSAVHFIEAVKSSGQSGPHNPQLIAEIQLEMPMRLAAAVGPHALVVGSAGVAVLSTGASHVTPYQFPVRKMPIVAGAAANQFVVALSSSIEEWDPQARMPRRRLKLPRPAAISAVGGSERVVWMTTQQDPTRIDVFALVHRTQPKQHQLPEPIAHVAAHPRSDLLVCTGAETGRVFVVDVDGRDALRTIAVPGLDRIEAAGLVLGRTASVLAAQTGRPLAVVALDGREPTAALAAPATLPIPRQSANGRVAGSTLYGDDEAPVAPSSAAQALAVQAIGRLAREENHAMDDRVRRWDERVRDEASGAVAVEMERSSEPHRSWRDDLVIWARAISAGARDRDCPQSAEIAAMAVRFELALELLPAVSLLYGSHLGGQAGVAAVDLARVLDGNWDEALGKGRLHASGLAQRDASRIRLAACVERALDGLPPVTGTLVGESGPVSILGPCVVVAANDDLTVIASVCLASAGGAILAANENAAAVDVVLEARAYGAVAMVRVAGGERAAVTDEPIIIVVPDQATAATLALPQLQ